MLTQKFNNKDYSIPTEWSDITVKMVIDSNQLIDILEDAPTIVVLSTYTGIPLKELKLSKKFEVEEILSTMAFIAEDYKPVPRTEFIFNDEKYSCELDIVDQNFEDWVSIQTCLSNTKAEPYRALPRLLAIYCKKDGETLSDFNLDERSKLFEGVSITIAKDIEAFFLTSLVAYKSVMWAYSTQDIQKELMLDKLNELRNTLKQQKVHSGMSFGMRLRIGYYQICLWWVRNRLVKYYNLESTSNSKKNWMQTCKKLLMKLLKRKDNGDSHSKL